MHSFVLLNNQKETQKKRFYIFFFFRERNENKRGENLIPVILKTLTEIFRIELTVSIYKSENKIKKRTKTTTERKAIFKRLSTKMLNEYRKTFLVTFQFL